ncbi:unnamed protein product [Pleuronectes platessa]|uniref:EGF-like domain-containing protein n=1 Tax=Pleuronectes platessa TaxID=8262 RepID=A0A9N7V9T1_PLEPL|nr:unnamed protein product [Pleuronectes platessa]
MGTYNCGTCRCEPGYLGARCECQEGDSSSLYLSACREAEGKQVCSGRGECSCNQCLCYESEFGKIYGAFCECDDFSCARHKGVLCSGHGECHCGEFGRGHCVCGRCQCTEPGAFGDTCEKCPTCPDACGTKRDCIECRLFNSGRLADNQTCQRLCKDEIITVESFNADDPGAVLCLYKTDNDCVMKFTYSEHASGRSVLTALKEPECGGGPDAMTVLLAVVGSILLVGVVLLAVWKLAITIHDRREFTRFQNARSRARYEMASNPLYKQPVTTHFVETDFDMYGKSYNGGRRSEPTTEKIFDFLFLLVFLFRVRRRRRSDGCPPTPPRSFSAPKGNDGRSPLFVFFSPNHETMKRPKPATWSSVGEIINLCCLLGGFQFPSSSSLLPPDRVRVVCQRRPHEVTAQLEPIPAAAARRRSDHLHHKGSVNRVKQQDHQSEDTSARILTHEQPRETKVNKNRAETKTLLSSSSLTPSLRPPVRPPSIWVLYGTCGRSSQ